MAECHQCGAPDLPPDVLGLNRKLVNRGVTRFLCLSCLARAFGEREESLLALADRLREQGCTLFPQRGNSGANVPPGAIRHSPGPPLRR